ncbi:hypothetical protein KRR26_24965 [Corallococcus sp. M34]|uniref:hypothetical protein n=1 Tax=Citreicoccus inhibens TaxID=2849499 RepID=UPI001C24F154|nr:hypothetical protein [Citreicoccus inhibens]MBU8898867.1 hypothetical protein [Citreicoccus inhibens]
MSVKESRSSARAGGSATPSRRRLGRFVSMGLAMAALIPGIASAGDPAADASHTSGLNALDSLAMAAPLQASGPVLVTCPTGNQNQDFTPPIGLLPLPVVLSGSGQFSSCTASDDANLNYGDYTVDGGGTASCLSASMASTTTITWNDGTTSTIAFSASIATQPIAQPVVILFGNVVAGRYQGALALKSLVTNPLPPLKQCLTVGVAHTSGPAGLTLIKL